jgi:hypothetical protein
MDLSQLPQYNYDEDCVYGCEPFCNFSSSQTQKDMWWNSSRRPPKSHHLIQLGICWLLYAEPNILPQILKMLSCHSSSSSSSCSSSSSSSSPHSFQEHRRLRSKQGYTDFARDNYVHDAKTTTYTEEGGQCEGISQGRTLGHAQPSTARQCLT